MNRLRRSILSSTRRSRVVRYSLALGFVAAVTAARWAAIPVFGWETPFPGYGCAIVLATWFGGIGPGILAALLSAGAGTFIVVWLDPFGTGTLPAFGRLGLFTIEGFFVVAAVGLLARVVREHEEGTRIAREQHDRDTAERQRAGEALRHSEEKYRLIVEGATGFAMILLDKQGVVTGWNTGAERLLGYPEKEVLGQHFAVFFRPEDRERGLPMRELETAARKEIGPDDNWIVRKDGSQFWASGATSALRDDGDKLRGFAKIIRDMTGQKEAAEKLERAVVERTAQLKDVIGELEAFAYSMAHDLRGPLRTMQGYANILKADYGAGLDPVALGYVERIGVAADRMHRLVRDVLTYSQLTQETLPLENVALQPLVQDIVEQYPTLQEAQVRVANELPPVHGNRALLTQLISNLLTNAVKFVPAGRRPEIELRAETDTDWVTLSVSDNGIGIAPENRDRIFRMFERIDSAERYEGTGIGLTIVRRAVERLGGHIGIESEIGRGSRFWVKLKSAR